MIDWKPRDAPDFPPASGHFVRVDPLRADRDAEELFGAIAGSENQELWRYIPFGPPESPESLMATLAYGAESQGWQTLVLRGSDSGEMLGMASYMRVRKEAGSAEVGCVVYSKALKRTPAATEAMFFMARHLFDDLGYRRFEWKCDNENAASKSAARRLGFCAEGVFRQDMVVRGQNRDTAWFSMIDSEWPQIRSAFEEWLAESNFDDTGQQRRPLAEFRDQRS
jgi:RimJ/RimL family protein N-acetyltransferase